MNETISISKNKNIINCIYWCPKCNHIEKVNIVSKLKVEFVNPIETLDARNIPTFNPISIEMNRNIFCQECEEEMVQIDNEIISVILKLNSVGLKTEFCCSGHGKIDQAYIMFAPGIKLPSIPENWEKVDNEFRSLFINVLNLDQPPIEYIREYVQPDSSAFIPSYDLYIRSLQEWADTLTKDSLNIPTNSLPQENQFIARVDFNITTSEGEEYNSLNIDPY